MNFQIQCAPVFSVIEFQLNSGEQVIAQPDSMVSMTSGMRIRASASTGTGVVGRSWRAGFRSLLGGESFSERSLRLVVTTRCCCWLRKVTARFCRLPCRKATACI